MLLISIISEHILKQGYVYKTQKLTDIAEHSTKYDHHIRAYNSPIF